MKTLGFSLLLKLFAFVEDNTKYFVVFFFFSCFSCELFFLEQIRIFPFVINIVSWSWQKCQEQATSL